jgi:hypothetical protein
MIYINSLVVYHSLLNKYNAMIALDKIQKEICYTSKNFQTQILKLSSSIKNFKIARKFHIYV